jgi:hypothetical protein
MNQRRLLLTSAMCSVIVLLSGRVEFAQVVDLLPNLTPQMASEISVVQDQTNGHILLRFAAVNRNLGAGPLDVHAGGVTGSGQQVYQRIYRTDGSYHDELAGTMTYHPAHNHFHVNNFELYTLTPAGEDRLVTGKTSEKTSFCLEDTTPIDLRLPGAPQHGVYTTCNPDVQGISVGWGDRYGPTLPGQSFDITGDPEGDYDLWIEADPGEQFFESNENDNVSCVRLHIDPTARTVQTLGTCGSVIINSITPNTIKPGTAINVTITGTGFTSGIAVGFENGTGPAPVASNVVVVNASTITAKVTVKSGGGKQTRYWDVRVGSGALFRAFTVKQ